MRISDWSSDVCSSDLPLTEWIAMFDLAIAHCDDPALPLKAGASLHVRHLGVLGHVLMNCQTLGEVAEQLARYIRLLGQIGRPEVRSEDRRAGKEGGSTVRSRWSPYP